jgi:hypothetical protein
VPESGFRREKLCKEGLEENTFNNRILNGLLSLYLVGECSAKAYKEVESAGQVIHSVPVCGDTRKIIMKFRKL